MKDINIVDILGQISDLKNVDYRNTLAIATLIELLIEKDVLNRHEFAKKAQQLDALSLEELRQFRELY